MRLSYLSQHDKEEVCLHEALISVFITLPEIRKLFTAFHQAHMHITPLLSSSKHVLVQYLKKLKSTYFYTTAPWCMPRFFMTQSKTSTKRSILKQSQDFKDGCKAHPWETSFMEETGLASVSAVSVWLNQLSSLCSVLENDIWESEKERNKREWVGGDEGERDWGECVCVFVCLCSVPTQISAFVVMAFPWYKLIISGARYDRVVYLSREEWK